MMERGDESVVHTLLVSPMHHAALLGTVPVLDLPVLVHVLWTVSCVDEFHEELLLPSSLVGVHGCAGGSSRYCWIGI